MGKQTVYIIVACILAVCIPLLPKLVQARVWTLRKVHLFRLADWHERNKVVLVTEVESFFGRAILLSPHGQFGCGVFVATNCS
jgi:hypothetical protein